MPRFLNGFYPCVVCGDDVQVKSRAHIQFARCEECGERQRLSHLVISNNERRARLVLEINAGELSTAEALAKLGAAMTHAGRALQSAAQYQTTNKHHANVMASNVAFFLRWIKGAAERFEKLAVEHLEANAPPMSVVSSTPVEQLESVERALPQLRLIRKEEAK